MPSDEGRLWTRKALQRLGEEVPDMIVDPGSVEAPAICLHQFCALLPHFEGGHREMRVAQLSLDGDRARAEADIPEAPPALQLQQAQAHETNRHLRDHIHPSIQGEEVQLLESERSVIGLRLHRFDDQAIGMREVLGDDFLEGERIGLFPLTSEEYPHVHPIGSIAIVEHTLSDGGRRILPIRQHPYLMRPLDEGSVELMPRSSRQRDDTHVVVRQAKGVR